MKNSSELRKNWHETKEKLKQSEIIKRKVFRQSDGLS